jgi:hypothetical protein
VWGNLIIMVLSCYHWENRLLSTYERTVESSRGSETKNKNSLSPQYNVSWQQFWHLRDNSSLHLCNKYLFNYVMNWSFNFYRGKFFPEQDFSFLHENPTFFCNTQKDNFFSTFNNIPFCIFRIKDMISNKILWQILI